MKKFYETNKMKENSKIKVLHIIPRLIAGGAERMVLDYSHRLDAERFSLAVATTAGSGPLASQFKGAVALLAAKGGRILSALRIWRFIHIWKPDIIHTHLFGADFFGWFFKHLYKFHWVSTQHSVEHQSSFLRRFIWQRILKSSDAIIAVAKKVKDYDSKYFKIASESINLIQNGVDTHEFSAIPPLNFRKDSFSLGIVGRLEDSKGHQCLFEALSRVSKNWTLHIFGEGSNKDALIHLAKKYSIDDRIMWHGIEKDHVALYGSLDIVIQPSLREGLSLAVMEAMSAGRLVIASEVAGAELIEDSVNGLVVKANEPDLLAQAIMWSMDHTVEAQEFALHARDKAVKNFDIHVSIAKLEKVYESLLNKNA